MSATLALQGQAIPGDTLSVTIVPDIRVPLPWWARFMPRLAEWICSRTVTVVVGYGWDEERCAMEVALAVNHPYRRFLGIRFKRREWPYVATVTGKVVTIAMRPE